MTAASRGEAEALERDAADELAHWRARFRLPVGRHGPDAVYVLGNSHGAQPVAAAAAVQAELEAWATHGVEGQFRPDVGWIAMDERLHGPTSRLVGAGPLEVATMNTLTVNLHMLLASFYRPAGRRSAILIDAPTFPSDRYAVDSQLRLHGLDPATDLVVVRPRQGEATLRTEDVEAAIARHADRLAVTLLAGVNYATGQVMDVARLTRAAHAVGALAGWDLAHAAGNIRLSLHDWDVDFAAWCTYKYLNGGPGSLAQVFIHERHATAAAPRLAGWWGNDLGTRFEMAEAFRPAAGADGWRVSTPPTLAMAPLVASYAIFDEVGMAALRAKSESLTGYLAGLIADLAPDVELLTPADPASRGAQLSLRVPRTRERLAALETHGIMADFREPDIIRVAPVPLYNSFHDAWRVATALALTA